VVEYTAMEAPELDVVFEGAKGDLVLYSFELNPKDVLLVIGQVVHVPRGLDKKKPKKTVALSLISVKFAFCLKNASMQNM
jgi:hypothetical protein